MISWFLFYLSCRKFNNQIHIVGLNLCFVSSLVPYYLAAFVAAVDNYISAFSVGFGFYRAKNSAAAVSSVTRVNVYMQRREAEGTMVSRGVTERENFFAAIYTDEAGIVFLKSLVFHKALLNYFLLYLPTQNFEKILLTTSSLTCLPSSSDIAPSALSISAAQASCGTPIESESRA